MTTNAVAELTASALAESGDSPRQYISGLRAACEESPPPFGKRWYGDLYREASSSPEWLAQSLVGNAAKEGEGAQKLWDLACRIDDPGIAEQVRRHAIDESRHSRVYVGMLELTFPGAISDDLRPLLKQLSPGYSARDRLDVGAPSSLEQVIDELVQVNIGEIRTRIHQLLLRPVIMTYSAETDHTKLSGLLQSILSDETRHVAYTATLLETFIDQDQHLQDFIRTTFRQRLQEFNEITLDEVDGRSFEGA